MMQEKNKRIFAILDYMLKESIVLNKIGTTTFSMMTLNLTTLSLTTLSIICLVATLSIMALVIEC
jgi:hypothetical protein